MKMREIVKLILIWIATNFSVTFYAAIRYSQANNRMDDLMVFFLISSMLSIPAVIFFTIVSYRILKSHTHIWKAKMKILAVNYLDIIATLFIINLNHEPTIKRIAIPLFVFSTVWILIMPLNLLREKTSLVDEQQPEG